jgi:hypothetical protein
MRWLTSQQTGDGVSKRIGIHGRQLIHLAAVCCALYMFLTTYTVLAASTIVIILEAMGHSFGNHSSSEINNDASSSQYISLSQLLPGPCK